MHPSTLARRLFRRAALALSLATLCASTPPPPPASVTVAGTFQSEQGCPGDWDAACAKTHLTRNPVDGVFRDFFTMPEGHQEFKVTLNDSWDENYGVNATRDGANLGFDSPAGLVVKFFYDPVTHWATSSSNTAIAVAVGSFQKSLGCTDNWLPDCMLSWLTDEDGDGIHHFKTTALPAGTYEAKVAHNESWDVNFGANGEPGGANIPFSVPAAGQEVGFTYDPFSHQLSIAVAAPTQTTFTLSPGTVALGEMVTLSAQVVFTEGTGTPSGRVLFDYADGSGTVGVASLDGNGVATTQVPAAGTGTYTLVASYNGMYLPSTSGPQTVVITPAAAKANVALELAPTAAVSGQPVTLTAKVTAADTSAGTPSGSVTFLEGTTELGTAQLGPNGQAALTHAFSVGTHALKAAYSGDSTFAAVTSAEQPLTVAKAASTVQLTSSQNPSVYGQPVTFTAQMAAVAPGAGVPGGRVTFQTPGGSGPIKLGEATLDSSGRATLSTSTLTSATVTAVYAGDDGFEGSTSAELAQQVDAAATRTTLTTSKSSTVYGESFTVRAVVEPVAPGAGQPAGRVKVTVGSYIIDAALGADGVVSFSHSDLGAGTNTLTAKFVSDAPWNFAHSDSAPYTQQVARGATTTSVQMTPREPTLGQDITFDVQVSPVAPASGSPSGLLTLKDGGKAVAYSGLQSNGFASIRLSGITQGPHTFSIEYAGDTSFTGSTSSTFDAPVSKLSSTVFLEPPPSSAVSGEGYFLTAQVRLAGGSVRAITGSLTLRDGATELGTEEVFADGRATFGLALGAGTHSLTVSYSGDTNIYPSTSPEVRATVNRGATTTVLTSSLNPSPSGQAVTLTARVAVTAPAQGKPSGEVLFKADGAALGTGTLDANNEATLNTTALAAGTHALTAEYTGDTQFEASAAQPLSQTVTAQETPDAGTSVDAGTQPGTDGGSQPGTDAGTQPGTDAGTSTDAGIGPTNTPPPTEAAGGCGCTAGDGSASGFLLMLGAWVSLSVLRRRAGRFN